VLEWHMASIRTVAVKGDLVIFASYDFDARVRSLMKMECLHVLKRHEKQIYSVDFDGKKAVAGTLDSTARVWDPFSGAYLAILKGHTSLLGQL